MILDTLKCVIHNRNFVIIFTENTQDSPRDPISQSRIFFVQALLA